MSTWVEETNRQFFEVAQAASLKMNKGAFNLILDSRSETDNDRYELYKAPRNECNESLLSIAERRRRLVEISKIFIQ